MSNSIKANLLALVFLLCITQVGRTQIDSAIALPAAFNIDSISVIHGATPGVGDTVHLIVHFTALMTGPASFNLHFPNSIAPPNQVSGQTESDSAITVDSGYSYSYSMPLKLFAYSNSGVEFFISPDSQRNSYAGGYGYVDMAFSSASFSYYSSMSTLSIPSPIPITAENLTPGSAILNISGTVTYADQNQLVSGVPANKGAYGVWVIVAFTKGGVAQSGFDGTTELYQPFSGCTPNIDFAHVAADGTFNISYVNGPDWSRYDDVVILVTTSNDATHAVAAGGYNMPTYTLQYTAGGCSNIETFQPNHWFVIPITNHLNITQTGANISLNFPEGCTFRNEEFSREFDSVRVGIEVSQVLTQINLSGSVPDFNGIPNPSPDVTHLNVNISGLGGINDHVIDHEWGHYTQWALQEYNFGTGEWTDTAFQRFAEGFAEFNQFAVRNYVNYHYSDITDWGPDPIVAKSTAGNCEEAPFYSYPNRFNGVYGDGGDLPMSRKACFFWNIYDGYTDVGFKASQYAGSDNDDIGFPMMIYNYLKNNTGTTTLYNDAIHTNGYLPYLQSNVPSGAWNSVQDIEICMAGDGTHPMRPAQITNLSGFNDIGFYDNIVLAWQLQNYSSGSYQNFASSINVLHSGSIVTSVSGTALGANFHEPDAAMTFVVTASNSSGNSYNAPNINIPADKMADGLAPLDTDLVMTVHPNPATSLVRICVPDLPPGYPFSVVVVNSSGQVVATLYNAIPEAEIGLCLIFDCSKVPDGIYFARIWNDILGQSVKISVTH